MEQNLSERERKIRLGIGIVFGVSAIVTFLQTENINLVIGLLLASAGFIMNYFTCFCGTKKLMGKLRDKF